MTDLGSSCGACKFLRKKCTSECVFAPYFCYGQAATHFATVHKVFGASNVSKLLLNLPVQNRSNVAFTISYEALARAQDPIYDCVAYIFALQQQVANLQEQIKLLGNQMANFVVGVTDSRNSQPTTYQCSESQVCPQHDMNVLGYQSEQPAFVNHTGNTTKNLVVDYQMNEMLIPLCRWDHQISVSDTYLSPVERLFEGVDQEILAYFLCMNSGNHASS